MPELARTLLVRLLLCAAVAWIGWVAMWWPGLVLLSPLFGVALARPLLETWTESGRFVRTLSLEKREGHHYEFRGTYVRIIEDHEHRRWIRAADVRRILGTTDSDSALRLTYREGFVQAGQPREAYFSEDALLAHLRRQGTAAANRLRLWVERVVAGPARERRRRLGIHAPDPATLA